MLNNNNISYYYLLLYYSYYYYYLYFSDIAIKYNFQAKSSSIHSAFSHLDGLCSLPMKAAQYCKFYNLSIHIFLKNHCSQNWTWWSKQLEIESYYVLLLNAILNLLLQPKLFLFILPLPFPFLLPLPLTPVPSPFHSFVLQLLPLPLLLLPLPTLFSPLLLLILLFGTTLYHWFTAN